MRPERRSAPRRCAEPGCARQPQAHSAYCGEHLRAWLKQAFGTAQPGA